MRSEPGNDLAINCSNPSLGNIGRAEGCPVLFVRMFFRNVQRGALIQQRIHTTGGVIAGHPYPPLIDLSEVAHDHEVFDDRDKALFIKETAVADLKWRCARAKILIYVLDDVHLRETACCKSIRKMP